LENLVIPTINCADFGCAKERIKEITSFSSWVHIDVADGKFTKNVTWANPNEPILIKSKLKIEAHLMVENPEDLIEPWLAAGAKRIIVHLETIKNIDVILKLCAKYKADAVLSLDSWFNIQDVEPYLGKFNHFQVLAVEPGLAGQNFDKEAINKIKFLRQKMPNATIEIDGGINPDTAKLAKEAGADIFAAASYIFSCENPKAAFKTLNSI
jgi:ribulose-phosphate 3-epimerase